MKCVQHTQEKFVLAITFIYYFMAFFYCFTTSFASYKHNILFRFEESGWIQVFILQHLFLPIQTLFYSYLLLLFLCTMEKYFIIIQNIMSNVSGDKHLIQNLLQKHKLKCLFIKSNSQKLYKLFLFTLLSYFSLDF